MATATIRVTVSDMPEVRELVEAAAVLLATLGERGEMKSYDREPARLAGALNGLHYAVTEGRLARRSD